MRDEAVRALRAYEERMQPQPRRIRSSDVPAWEPPPRREAPPRAYGSRHRDDARQASVVVGPGDGVPGRRTIEITGQAAPPPRRRPTSTSAAAAAYVGRPDRTALWAFLLALFLVLMAVATAHAAAF
jgi:hypothetical protein